MASAATDNHHQQQQLSFVLAGMGLFPPSNNAAGNNAAAETSSPVSQKQEELLKEPPVIQWKKHALVAICAVCFGIIMLIRDDLRAFEIGVIRRITSSSSSCMSMYHPPTIGNLSDFVQEFFVDQEDTKAPSEQGGNLMKRIFQHAPHQNTKQAAHAVVVVRDNYAALRSADHALACLSTGFHQDLLQLGQISNQWRNRTSSLQLHYIGSLFASTMDNSMGKFLSTSGADKDPSDWTLGPFQEALSKTCAEIASIRKRHSNNFATMEDLLLPERLCTSFTATGTTMGSLLRIGNLLEDSLHGQLSVHDFVNPFALQSMNESATLVIVDAGMAGRNPAAWINHENVAVVARTKSDILSLPLKALKTFQPCACPPSHCLCKKLEKKLKKVK